MPLLSRNFSRALSDYMAYPLFSEDQKNSSDPGANACIRTGDKMLMYTHRIAAPQITCISVVGTVRSERVKYKLEGCWKIL